MIEKLTFHKEIDALKELRHLWVINDGYIQQPIVRYGIRCLPITCGIADANGHHSTFDDIRVDLDMHLVVEALESHEYKGEEERERTGTENMMGLATQVHDSSNQSDVDAVEEIAMTFLSLLVGIATVCSMSLSLKPQK